jgi:8-oxo-dGTP diphosphatase
VTGQPRTSDESVQVDWLTADQVRELMTDAYAVRLLDAVQEPHLTPVRVHDGRKLL